MGMKVNAPKFFAEMLHKFIFFFNQNNCPLLITPIQCYFFSNVVGGWDDRDLISV